MQRRSSPESPPTESAVLPTIRWIHRSGAGDSQVEDDLVEYEFISQASGTSYVPLLPPPRTSHCCCASPDGGIYVFGGSFPLAPELEDEGTYRDMWKWKRGSPGNKNSPSSPPSGWLRCAPASVGRWGHRGVWMNTINEGSGAIVVLGGIVAGVAEDQHWLSPQIYFAHCDQWSPFIACSSNPRYAQFASLDSTMSSTTTGSVSSVTQVDSAKKPLTQPPHRLYFTAERMSLPQKPEFIVLFGGLGIDAQPMNDVAEIYCRSSSESTADLSYEEMKTCGATPKPRYGHGSCALNSEPCIIIHGGQDADKNYFSDMFVLNCAQCTWREVKISALPTRAFHMVFADQNDFVFCFGGATHGDYVEDLIAVCPYSGKFFEISSNTGPYPKELQVATCCVVRDAKNLSAFVFGGQDADDRACGELLEMEILEKDRQLLRLCVRPNQTGEIPNTHNRTGSHNSQASCHLTSSSPTESRDQQSTLSEQVIQRIEQLRLAMSFRFNEIESRLEETNRRVDRLRDAVERGGFTASAQSSSSFSMGLLIAEVRALRLELNKSS